MQYSTVTKHLIMMDKKLFYMDENRRVYELNGVKRNAPYHIGYFVPVEVVGENSKEFICDYGVINKKSKLYSRGAGWSKKKVYTEQEMLDEVYVVENRYLIIEKIRKAPANVLKGIASILDENGVE